MGRKRKESYFERFFKEDPPSTKNSPPCSHEGCPSTGIYPAPKSRTEIGTYIFFCLEHVRIYNFSWDYYKDMGEEDIFAQQNADLNWRRPTWSFRQKSAYVFSSDFISEVDEIFQSEGRIFNNQDTIPLGTKENAFHLRT
jgi:hypothetical protein